MLSTAPRSDDADVDAIARALAAPFDAREVKFKPGAVSGNRALALAYIDARLVAERLDEVLGIDGWQDEYESVADGSVVCRLRLCINGEWITKMDVGGQSEQSDEGDRRKAAFSDALKRAAVKFGIGRYLYRLPALWCDYDSHKRQFVRPPALPPSALPAGEARSLIGEPASPAGKAPEQRPAQKTPPAKSEARSLPANGSELLDRLQTYDASLARKDICQPGQLVQRVAKVGIVAGLPEQLEQWSGNAISMAVAEVKAAEADFRRDAIQRELDRIRRAWPFVAEALRYPQGIQIHELTPAQWDEAMRTLRAEKSIA